MTEERQLLKFTTAGSVDDGKSTLIGRLLYETKGVFEDQLASVQKSGINRSSGPIDFSLLTDGLRAEREQGITIDVAYRYFATSRRKFIIADTPGHEQYTRNMATGASKADLAIILIDARKGVLQQSRRHAFITALLGIRHAAVAVNKMDLVDFSQEVFEQIQKDFLAFAAQIGLRGVQFFPVSALDGDNIVERSPRSPWYTGPSLLQHLETVPVGDAYDFAHVRFPIQYVIRPDLDFRGFAGQLAAGVLKPGDTVMTLPSRKTSKVKSLPSFDGDLAEAFAPMSITVTLEDEIDLSRGDMLVSPTAPPHVSRRFSAKLVWMQESPGQPHKNYLLKQTTQVVNAQLSSIDHRINVNTLAHEPAEQLELNEIAAVTVETRRPLYFDLYSVNREMGSFILIDPISNLTVAAGMIHAVLPDVDKDHQVTQAERQARHGHKAMVLHLPGEEDLARSLERKLFDRGCAVVVLNQAVSAATLGELEAAGFIVLCTFTTEMTLSKDLSVLGNLLEDVDLGYAI